MTLVSWLRNVIIAALDHTEAAWQAVGDFRTAIWWTGTLATRAGVGRPGRCLGFAGNEQFVLK